MIRLLVVAESLGAGVLTFLLEQFANLDDEFEVKLLYGKRSETPSELPELVPEGCELCQIDFKLNPLNVIKVIRAEMESGVEIVHAHSSVAGFIVRIAGLFSKNKPVIFYNPHAYSFLRKDYKFLPRISFFVAEFLMSKISGAITVSVSESEHDITVKKLKNSKGILIRNGVSINPEIEEAIGDNEGRVRVGAMGRLIHQKNPELFAGLAREFPQYDFVWIGGGDYKIIDVPKNLRITGWLSRDCASAQLNLVDIYMQVSLWEGLSLSLLEAMRRGKACVVSNIEENSEPIEHGKSGMICDDFQQFKQAIRFLGENPEARYAIGRRAREVVRAKYALEKALGQYTAVYRQALREARRY